MKRSPVLIVLVLFSLGLVIAISVPDFGDQVVDESHNGVVVTIPDHAMEVSPGVFFIGTTLDIDGSLLEGYAIVDYKPKKENAKPSWAGGGKKTEGDDCYAFISRGAKWKVLEGYLVDPINNRGLDEQKVRDIVNESIDEWEVAAGKEIFLGESFETVDAGSIGNIANGQNEVVFGSINEPRVIAVTYVWGIFGGRPDSRRIAEWDQVYNQESYDWSFSEEAGKMDFENIVQHEIGHSFGLGHPSDGCTEETMYRFASFGETIKRDLNTGDISGIQKLYA